jgi:hypothetical protein
VIAETEQFAKIPYGKYPSNYSSAGVYIGASSPSGNPMVQNSPKYPESKWKVRERQPATSQDIVSDNYQPQQPVRDVGNGLAPGRFNLSTEDNESRNAIAEDMTSDSDGSDSDIEAEIKSGADIQMPGMQDTVSGPRDRSRFNVSRTAESFPGRDNFDVEESEVERQIQDIMRLEKEVEGKTFEKGVEPIAEEDEFVSEIQSGDRAMASAERDSALGDNVEALHSKSETRSTRGTIPNDSNLLRGRSRLGQVSSLLCPVCQSAKGFIQPAQVVTEASSSWHFVTALTQSIRG